MYQAWIWLKANSPWMPLAICTVYLAFCYIGPKVMANRKAYDLRGPLVAWNFLLAYFSFVGALRWAKSFFFFFVFSCRSSRWRIRIGGWARMYLLCVNVIYYLGCHPWARVKLVSTAWRVISMAHDIFFFLMIKWGKNTKRLGLELIWGTELLIVIYRRVYGWPPLRYWLTIIHRVFTFMGEKWYGPEKIKPAYRCQEKFDWLKILTSRFIVINVLWCVVLLPKPALFVTTKQAVHRSWGHEFPQDWMICHLLHALILIYNKITPPTRPLPVWLAHVLVYAQHRSSPS